MRYSAGLAVIVVTLAASACTKEGSARDGAEAERQNAAYAEPATGTVGAASSTGTVSSSAATTIKVYKDPNCGCCNNWVEHLKENGFAVEAINESNMSAIKEKYAIGRGLQSCHTAVVGDYAIEGHVPADLIRKLLAEKPAVAGLAVPGMPIGSPGMEGATKERYDVLTFDRAGRTSVYAQR